MLLFIILSALRIRSCWCDAAGALCQPAGALCELAGALCQLSLVPTRLCIPQVHEMGDKGRSMIVHMSPRQAGSCAAVQLYSCAVCSFDLEFQRQRGTSMVLYEQVCQLPGWQLFCLLLGLGGYSTWRFVDKVARR